MIRRDWRRGLAMPAMLAVAPALAWGLSGEALERRVHEIADGLRCPTCQSVSVNDSHAEFSRQIRDKVRRMVREGQSEAAIRAFFVSTYGEWILRAPKKEGLGLVLWILPGAAVLLGGGWLGWRAHQAAAAARVAREAAAPREAELSAEERRLVERDLERFEEES